MKTDAWVDTATNTRYTWSSGNEAVFLGDSGSVNLDSAVSASSVSFQSSGYTLGGSALTLTGSGTTISATESATINSAINLGANQQWTTASGKTLSISGALSLSNYALTIVSERYSNNSNWLGKVGNWIL
jgi:hypothetical protein